MENEKKKNSQNQDRDIQNQFTAYLEKALYRGRLKFLERENKRKKHMVTWEPELLESIAAPDDDFFDQIFADDEQQLFENLRFLSVIKTVSERSMIILQLHILYEHTFHEIGEILSLPEENVKANYYRTVKYIREKMGGHR